jgi:Asp-tRNA(Asn)/Glu-tRNA(Gln) amidotransferase A subunit family amidase
MVDGIHADHSKIKIGLLTETPFLPVSKSVKRAIGIAKQALLDEGYQVVEVTFSPEDYATGRNLLIGMVASGAGPGLISDLEKSGEQKTMGTWANLFLLGRGPIGRFFIKGILSLAGMGRLRQAL